MEIKPKSREEIQGIVTDAIQNAVDFVESEITDIRIKSQRYMDGEVDIGFEKGRSKVTSTKVRDVIRAVKPSIMRVFLSSSKPVEYVPKGPEDVALAGAEAVQRARPPVVGEARVASRLARR